LLLRRRAVGCVVGPFLRLIEFANVLRSSWT
jgi:hypothetical protein